MQRLDPSDTSGILPIAYFHALARLGGEGLILIEPETPFVSLGVFDDAATTVDLDYCRAHGLPVMRRQTGGGMVLLGPRQVFYTLVVKRPHRPIPARVNDAYGHLSQAPISVYRELGIETRLRPINDIVTLAGRKIAGQGAGDINGRFCFVGSILLDFDVDLMHRIVKLPSEALRAPLKAAITDHLTSVARETGAHPDVSFVKDCLAKAFAPLVGGLEPGAVSPQLTALARTLSRELCRDALSSDDTEAGTLFKVREGLYLCQRAFAGRDGEIVVSLTIDEGRIASVNLSGHGLTHEPPDLERLIGRPFQRTTLLAELPDFGPLGIAREPLIDGLLATRG